MEKTKELNFTTGDVLNRFVVKLALNIGFDKTVNDEKFAEVSKEIFTDLLKALYDKQFISELSYDELMEMGCCRWDEPEEGEDGNKVLLLFPLWFYPSIAERIGSDKIYSINGNEADPNNLDDDIRFGMLAYGVYRYV